MALLFDALGTTFEAEQERVINKLKVRYPDKFTKAEALERDLTAEREVLERTFGSTGGYNGYDEAVKAGVYES